MLLFSQHCHGSEHYTGENFNVDFDDDVFLFILRRNKNPFQRHANEQANERWVAGNEAVEAKDHYL